MIVEIAAIVTAIATTATVCLSYAQRIANSRLPARGQVGKAKNGVFHLHVRVHPRNSIATICALEGVDCDLQRVVIRQDPDQGHMVTEPPGDHFVTSLAPWHKVLLPSEEPIWLECWAKPRTTSNSSISVRIRTSERFVARRHVATAWINRSAD